MVALAIGCGATAPVPARKQREIPRPAPTEPGLPPFDGLDGLAAMSTSHTLRTAHPIGAYSAAVRVGRGAEGYGTRGRGPMPEGAVIVESLAVKGDPTQDPLVHYVMRKRGPGFFEEGGDWEYAVADGEGTVQARGRLKLCARCHAEAPREFLFEPARGPEPRTSQIFPYPGHALTAMPPL